MRRPLFASDHVAARPRSRGAVSASSQAYTGGPPLCAEPLEQRFLMAFSANVNFQNTSAPVPAGYVPDSGMVYASRGNGYTYGWDLGNGTGRDRNSSKSPDQRYDTFIHSQERTVGSRTWSIAVPDGSYNVKLVSGDAIHADSVYKFNVEGSLFLSGTPSLSSPWVTAAKTVTVTDGRLTISNASGSVNNKLSFIDIDQIDSPPPPPTGVLVTVKAGDNDASEPGANTGRFTFARTGSTASPLTVNYTVGGTATSGADYRSMRGSVTLLAGKSTEHVILRPLDDTKAEGPETVVLTVADAAGYNPGAAASASITIKDNETGGGAAENRSPAAPVIREPEFNGVVVSGADVHMETGAFSDPDGDRLQSVDWEIWTTGANAEVVWRAPNVTEGGVHVHLGDGQFVNSLAGRRDLPADRSFLVRVRFRDDSGAGNSYSAWTDRLFRTDSEIDPIPNSPDWTADQAGYKIERLPLKFAAGEGELRMPTNIAFVPNPGNDADDPLLYVTELYGKIRVVTNDYTVHTYASGLLNYTPNGVFPGPGEQGLAGIVVEPATGDLFVTVQYDDVLGDETKNRFPKIVRLHSTDGGITAATRSDVLRMPGETQGPSHQISNITIGPDGKLYVHMGDGLPTPETALNLDSYRGKILRMNLNGTAPSDNPFYNSGNGINARDYVFAYGLRNPFGGAWRLSDGYHYEVENGSAIDRIARVQRGKSYGWNGTKESMKINALYTWAPPVAPVNIAFVEQATFGGSGFPSAKWGHAFVTESGPTYSTGPQGTRGKKISEFVFGASPDGGVVGTPRDLVHYTGNGKASAIGLAAGPGGLYFTDFYEDDPVAGKYAPTNPGANILRVVYEG